VLHRDIKLANILMTKDGTIKVGDFGLARTLENTAQLAQTACGTPYYISPELCHGVPYGQPSDVWAIGCTVFELLALARPFDGQNLHSVVLSICSKAPKSIPDCYPPECQELITSMLEKDQNARITLPELLEKPFLRDLVNEHTANVQRYQAEFAPPPPMVMEFPIASGGDAMVDEDYPISPTSGKPRTSHLDGAFKAYLPLPPDVTSDPKLDLDPMALTLKEGEASQGSGDVHAKVQEMLAPYATLEMFVGMLLDDDESLRECSYDILESLYSDNNSKHGPEVAALVHALRMLQGQSPIADVKEIAGKSLQLLTSQV